MKRFASWLLLAAILISCLLTGCNKNTEEEITTNESTTVTTPEDTDTPSDLPENAAVFSSANIVSGTSPAEQTAANDLKKYLNQVFLLEKNL